MAINVGINRWNKWFFDALEAKNAAAIFPLVIAIVVFVVVGILFWVGGSLTVTIGSTHLWIPGYIAIAAVLYACVVSGLTYFIGNPLVARVAAKNEGNGTRLCSTW